MKVSHIGAEQRRESRDALLAGQLLVVDLISESPALRTHGIVLNLSKSGMAVQTFRPLDHGQIAEIQLSLPKFSSSAGRGLVQWQKPGGVAGIRFLPPLKTLAELRQWVQRYRSPGDSDSALPLSACRTGSSATEFDTTLHLFACTAMALTGATGAAIALGNRSGMECRASIGSAPDLGAQLRPDTGISGHCLRAATVILCNDLLSDSRANTAAVQQMNIRSLVIVPIAVAEEVVGLVELFSPYTSHFDERHVQQLQPLVNVLAEAVQEETRNQPEQCAPAASSTINTFETEEPASAHSATSPQKHRFRTVAVGVVAVLLVLVVAAAWFTSRTQTNSLSKSNFPSSTPISSQQPLSAAKAVIRFSPPFVNQTVATAFDVNVILEDAKNVSSLPVQILYDPEKLRLITLKSGGLFDRDGQAAALVQRVDASAGRITASISRPSSAPGISGNGVAFTLSFMSKTPGRSRLRVDQTGLRDASARAVSVDSSEAVITISNPTKPAAGHHGPAEARTPPSLPPALSSSTADKP
jgi:hypothetical protein